MARDFSHIVGHAAEHFVCYDLAKRGFRAVGNMFEGSPYDVVAEHDGRLIKIQVKGTYGTKAKTSNGSATPTYKYCLTEVGVNNVDIIAYVALDVERVLYVDASQEIKKNGTRWISVRRMMGGDEAALHKYFGTNLVQSRFKTIQTHTNQCTTSL